MGSIAVAGRRAVDAQEAARIELATQKSECVPENDDHDPIVMQK